ncbi:MAG: T9SS type A sorting domain-containing protein [Flavobacteriales bacterium]|nr:T9SS type A sorting domain-containing protein [Flavobacteriales bacterium]
MKRLLLAVVTLFSTVGLSAQFGTAPDFSVTDLDGNEINLYADILDQGLVAVIDVSATWCGPCWGLHESHALEDLHQAYGPNGTNQLRVVYYEGDANTGMDAITGTGGNTLGDWTDGITYPIVNESPLTLDLGIWAPLGFPTVNIVRPSDYEIVADTYDQWSFEDQVNAINNSGAGIQLDPVSVNEVTVTAKLDAYPNPSNGNVTLSTQGFNGQAFVQVYNMVGAVVAELNTSATIETIDLSELPDGNYLVRVYNDEAEAIQRISIMK